MQLLKIKHIKRHYDIHIGIKKQFFIKKIEKNQYFLIFRYIEKSNTKILVFKKYQYFSMYCNGLKKTTILQLCIAFSHEIHTPLYSLCALSK